LIPINLAAMIQCVGTAEWREATATPQYGPMVSAQSGFVIYKPFKDI